MSDSYQDWAIVELMGHRRLAGYLTEQQIARAAFLRLDIHGTDTDAAAVTTQFYAPAAVYCITPTTEAIARAVGQRARPAPVSRFELEPARAGGSDGVLYADMDDGYRV